MSKRALGWLLLLALLLAPTVVRAQGACSIYKTFQTGDSLTATDVNSIQSTLGQTNMEFSCLDDYSASASEMQTTTDPNNAGSASLATTGAGELERLRFAIGHAFGFTVSGQWWQHYQNINVRHRMVQNHFTTLTGFQQMFRGEAHLAAASTRFHLVSFSVADYIAGSAHPESMMLLLHANTTLRFGVGIGGDTHVGSTLALHAAGTAVHAALFRPPSPGTGLFWPAATSLGLTAGGGEVARLHVGGLMAGVNASYDLGTTAGSRFRHLHLTGGVTAFGLFGVGAEVNTRNKVDFGGTGAEAFTTGSTGSTPFGYVSVRPSSVAPTSGTGDGYLLYAGTGSLNPTGASTTGASLFVDAPGKGGAGTFVNMASIYVSGPPSGGTNNYAMWVDTGNGRFDEYLVWPSATLASPGGGTKYIGPNGGADFLGFNVPPTGTFAWYGNDTERMRLTDTGILALGTTVTTSAGAGDLVLANNAGQIRAVNSAGTDTVSLLSLNSSNQVIFGTGASDLIQLNTTGLVAINDSANANMTLGLTINQGANDNEILALKSSDVAHGVTTETETDTFVFLDKLTAIGGALRLTALSDGDSTVAVGMTLRGISGPSADTTKATTSRGVIELESSVASGASTAVVAANGNLAVIRNGGTTTRFIFDAEGTGHADDVWTDNAFDLAEEYDVSEPIDEGTVVTVDLTHDNRLAPTSAPYQVVAGVRSYHTAQLRNAFGNLLDKYPQLALHPYRTPTAIGLVGLIPTKVTADNGPIRRGDLLVSSTRPGRAMRVDPVEGRTLNARFIVGVALSACAQAECVINVQR